MASPRKCLLALGAMLLLVGCGGSGSEELSPFGAPPEEINVRWESSALNVSEGVGTVTLTVTLSAISPTDAVTVDYVVSGTAQAPDDHSLVNGSVIITAGLLTTDITFAIVEDAVAEADETIVIGLIPQSGAILGQPAQITVTILDNEPSVSWQSAAQSVDEGILSGTVTVTAELSQTTSFPVLVRFSVSGTADYPDDHQLIDGAFTIPLDVLTASHTFLILDDDMDEYDETIILTIEQPEGATIGAQAVHTVTILNDDLPPVLTVGDTGALEPSEEMFFEIDLNPPSGKTVTVDVATANITATAGADYYELTLSTATFEPGDTKFVIAIGLINDTNYEANELLSFNLSSPTQATLGNSSAIGSIISEDPIPAVSVGNLSVDEGDTGFQFAGFNVWLSGTSYQTITVDYATADGTLLSSAATAGSDYVSDSGLLTFAPGETSKTVPVKVNGDTDVEGGPPAPYEETFTLSLSNAGNATIGGGVGVCTIIDDDLFEISIDDILVVEGDTGQTDGVFTVSLSRRDTTATITVDYATSDDTATAGAVPGDPDYDAIGATTLTFAPGELMKTITVRINGDRVEEPGNETFFVNLIDDPTNLTNPSPTHSVDPSKVAILKSQGVCTIFDDDTPVRISVDDINVIEGDGGDITIAAFTVRLSRPDFGATVTVDYATAPNTAFPSSPGDPDYDATTGTVSFTPGETIMLVLVNVNGDIIQESDETFFLNLSAATAGADISDNQAVCTILDEDTPPFVSIISDISVTEPDLGVAPAVFTLQLSHVTWREVNVKVETVDGTATTQIGQHDYDGLNEVITFNPGQTTFVLGARPGGSNYIEVLGDTVAEPDEWFALRINALDTPWAIPDPNSDWRICTIVNDDGPGGGLNLTIRDTSAFEGDSGPSGAVFFVTLNPASTQTVTVWYQTQDGTATVADNDYQPVLTTQLTFLPGEITKAIVVLINGDITIDEGDETFSVVLSAPTGAQIADDTGVCIILDDDDPRLSIDDVTLSEGDSGTTDFTFTVTLSRVASAPVTVTYETQMLTDPPSPPTIIANDGSLAGNIDFLPIPPDVAIAPNPFNPLTIPEGSTSATITVTVYGDTDIEDLERFRVILSNPNNASILDGLGRGEISADDPPTLTINNVSLPEGNAGTTAFTFTVTLSRAWPRDVEVSYNTVNGIPPNEATTADADYLGIGLTTLTFFAPNETEKTITVYVIGDTTPEADETFSVLLSNPVEAGITVGTGIGTIQNDD